MSISKTDMIDSTHVISFVNYAQTTNVTAFKFKWPHYCAKYKYSGTREKPLT